MYVPVPVIRYGYFPRPPPPKPAPPVVIVNSQVKPAVDCPGTAPAPAPAPASAPASAAGPGVIVVNTQGDTSVVQVGRDGRTSRPPVVRLPAATGR